MVWFLSLSCPEPLEISLTKKMASTLYSPPFSFSGDLFQDPSWICETAAKIKRETYQTESCPTGPLGGPLGSMGASEALLEAKMATPGLTSNLDVACPHHPQCVKTAGLRIPVLYGTTVPLLLLPFCRYGVAPNPSFIHSFRSWSKKRSATGTTCRDDTQLPSFECNKI